MLMPLGRLGAILLVVNRIAGYLPTAGFIYPEQNRVVAQRMPFKGHTKSIARARKTRTPRADGNHSCHRNVPNLLPGYQPPTAADIANFARA
jgi:hypothetical protein